MRDEAPDDVGVGRVDARVKGMGMGASTSDDTDDDDWSPDGGAINPTLQAVDDLIFVSSSLREHVSLIATCNDCLPCGRSLVSGKVG